jgi:TolA-binding protein
MLQGMRPTVWLAGGLAGILLLGWALVPLAPLFPSTAAMLETTRQIRQETEGLAVSVNQVDRQLAGLAEQESLLQAQGELVSQALQELQVQEKGAQEATGHLRRLAELEGRTVILTQGADAASARTAEVLRANQAAISQMGRSIGRIEAASAQVGRQVDLLLGAMAEAEENFAPIKRWKDRWTSFWQGLRGGVKGWWESWMR